MVGNPLDATNGVPLSPFRVWVVDDTADAVYVLGKLLEAMGQQVWTTHEPMAALERARHEQPDLVISDLGMPEMDGYELARRLRALPELADVVLVALTGYGQDSDRQRAIEAGFDHHLVKPVSVDALRSLLVSLGGAAASERQDGVERSTTRREP